MGLKEVLLIAAVVSAVSAQNYRVCVSTSLPTSICQSIGKDDSQVSCLPVESRLDCALKMARNEADIGFFSEEETMMLSLQQPNDNRVIATVRDVSKPEPYAFETVSVVSAGHINGLEGLKGGVYCHPGLDVADARWSPRVLKNLEELAARTDRCPDSDIAGKTSEELELTALNNFFSSGCRPGRWSANTTVDANLKTQFRSLCSRCGSSSDCSGYSLDMGVTIAGVNNENRHIQALECLRTNANGGTPAVAYVAWQHVREYFTIRNPNDAAAFAVMCTNGTLVPLSSQVLSNSISPCAFIRQPWGTIVASTGNAQTLLNNLRAWWPAGTNPGGNTWQSVLYSALVAGASARVVYQDTPTSFLNYTSPIRSISNIDSTTSCLPARRWCTTSSTEQSKCSWVRGAAHTLGVQPPLSCQQRSSVIECFNEIKADRADFISAASNYGYLARQHYQLTPVKLVQNSQAYATRVAAFVKASSVTADNVPRFENLRDKKACFPEYGGLAYVSFVRAGHERGVLSTSECDYARVVGEFFSGACAPGAIDASHSLSESNYNASSLCSVCQPTIPSPVNASICSWDYTNKYFGNNGSLACLADPTTDVAFLNTQNINAHLTSLGLQANQFRALCRNNSLAVNVGVNVDENCLLAYVVDAEVVTRRNDPNYNSLNTLFDTLNLYFGYSAAAGTQLINLEIFSPFDGNSDLLFKDSTIGLTEPTAVSNHELARNYIELFRHLQACTGSAPPVAGLASRSIYSVVALVVMSVMTRFVVY